MLLRMLYIRKSMIHLIIHLHYTIGKGFVLYIEQVW